jgi:hypothetical protein
MPGRLAALVTALLALAAASVAGARTTVGQPVAEKPVPSLTPVATNRLWKQLVASPQPQALARASACAPVRVILYAATDWLRLATRLASTPSPCAAYYVSIPPLTSDKSQPRPDQAWRIRALGPAFHAAAEINVTGWSAWVASTGSSWYAAGVEARKRMAAAGYDVAAGDMWALNEISSAVRQGAGAARQNIRDFLDGLHDGDGVLPVSRGAAWVIGFAQGAADNSVYQSRMQDWYVDQQFWTAMNRDVGDWQQEVFGDVRTYAVPGSSRETRRGALDGYLQHPAALAAAAPPTLTAAKAFVGSAYGPLANAAWQWESGYGFTHVPVDLMQDYVTAQVYAARSAGDARFGFAWQPGNLDGLPTADFNAQTDAILVRMAAAIADSSESPDGACGTDWCNRSLDGASFTPIWRSFSSWTGPPPQDTTPPGTTLLAGPSGTVTSTTASFLFGADETGSGFECSLDGAAFAPCVPPTDYAGLAPGPHHFEVRAIDPSGNADASPAAGDWTIAVPDGGRPHPAPPADTAARPDVPAFTTTGPRIPPRRGS